MTPSKYLIIITVFCLTFGTHAQSRKITFSAQNTPVKEALAQIQQKSGYRILFNDEVVPDGLNVSFSAAEASVGEILETILKNTELIHVVRSEDLIVITDRRFQSQTADITGKVTDEKGAPIPYANAVLYAKTDTVRLKQGAITNEQGEYKLVNIPDGNYRLKISYLGYIAAWQEINVSAQSSKSIVQNFTLKADEKLLQEVTVEGERPTLKAESGKLIYHAPSLLKNKPVTNAYDALKEVPGVIEQGDVILLVGTSGTTILLNGQKTSMTYEQTVNLLKTIPVSRLENIEVMYSAPPQYNIRGAALNVVLKQTAETEELQNTWQGETALEYQQKTYANGNGRANVLYLGKNTTVDVLYSGNFKNRFNSEYLTADHNLSGKIHRVEQWETGEGTGSAHNVRLALGHSFENKDKLDVAYVGIFDKNNPTRNSDAAIDENRILTDIYASGPSALHDLKADYTAHFGLNIGAEYTYYKDTTVYALQNKSAINNDRITSVSLQKIGKFFAYADQTHTLKNNWEINYGVNFYKTHSKNHSKAQLNNAEYVEASFDNFQDEYIWNIFAGFSKSFSQRLSLQASFAAEYYNAVEQSGNIKNTIWDDVAYFPNLNISYTFSNSHIFQFSLTSDKTYPTYWSLNPSVYQFGAYGVMYGNPHLRPMRNYDFGLTYIYKGKYVVRPFFSYVSDYFTQLPYQSKKKLQQEFVQQNYDYRKQMGVLAVVPFNITKRVSSRFITQGIYWHEKDDSFFDIPFDRHVFFGYVSLNNDINISSKPDLKMNVSAYYTTPAIQGIFNLSHTSNVSSGITWTFDKQRAKLILKANDIFKTSLPLATIDFKGQKSTLKSYQDARVISLSFIYRFGGFKEKEKKEVDTSRFGTN